MRSYFWHVIEAVVTAVAVTGFGLDTSALKGPAPVPKVIIELAAAPDAARRPSHNHILRIGALRKAALRLDMSK
jgi:hypothetical protein